MGSYLQSYGAGEEQRNRTIKRAILAVIVTLLVAWGLYVLLHNYFETRTVKHFLAEVNSGQYQAAYRDWGCTAATPCPNYDFRRFMEDWGPNPKIKPPWKVASVDGCQTFVTVNVTAPGAELQSLGVQRGAKTLMFAPGPECQERQWHWKAFFSRLFGRS